MTPEEYLDKKVYGYWFDCPICNGDSKVEHWNICIPAAAKILAGTTDAKELLDKELKRNDSKKQDVKDE